MIQAIFLLLTERDYLHVLVTIIETDIPETGHVLSTFAEARLPVTIIETDIPKTERVFPAFAEVRLPVTIMETDIPETEHVFSAFAETRLPVTIMETDIPEIGRVFLMFAEIHTVIKRYAAKTNAVLILGKTSKNPDGSDYRQAFFVCEKQEKYGEKNEKHIIKRTGCPFSVGVNYCKKAQEFVITKSYLEHNHDLCLNVTKFSTVMHKFDQNDLGLIEKLHNNDLQTKNIFSVLNSVSSKYIHKPDVYNAILFKTLQNDKNIVDNIATKTAHNDERDQDGTFIQAIFWAYHSAISDIDHFGSTYPLAFTLVYLETYDFYYWVMQQLSQVFIKLIGDAQHKESWLAPYTNGNINLDIKSSQHVESLHSKLKGVENRIIPVDRMLSILWRQLQEHSQKLAYETFLHQNRNTQDSTDVSLEELHLICSQFAFESFVKQQGDLAKSAKYEVLEYEESIYNITQISNQKKSTYVYLRIHVSPNEIHERWYVQHVIEAEHITNQVPLLVTQIFRQLPKCHHDNFLDLMKHTSEYVLETGKVSKLLQSESNIAQQKVLKMISIDNTTNSDNIKMPKGKCTCGHPSNNRRIHDNDMMLHLAGIKPDPRISQNLILQTYNSIGDDFHNNVLGYDINRLMAILLYMVSEYPQEY
ncbi:10885_t:CDS:2 [Ambispora gerdemannii]|uniref:10885_t:CDS:1 n=1 Tax=Ambispora gerdemannii TaxID=144530 RepID=A0A9N9D7Z0_9GLOM|nr:10885_t:CDS:2 [Ambispora gerdemannii]